MSQVKRRINGLSNIHVARMEEATNISKNNPTYSTPVPVKGAISAKCDLSYSEVKFFADNTTDYFDQIFEGGSIELEVSGLTIAEYELLFGMTSQKGGVTASSNAVAPALAVMFESKKLGSIDTRKYVIYNCKFAAPSIEAVTNKGTVEETSMVISGVIGELANGKQYAFADSDILESQLACDNWYNEVQFLDTPAPEVLPLKK